MANTVLENTGIDVATVFGSGSPEAIQAAGDNPGVVCNADVRRLRRYRRALRPGIEHLRSQPLARDPTCSSDEPGGYNGYQGLFVEEDVNPVIKKNGPMTDLDGNVIKDANGHIGFPGFDGMEATVSLSWTAQMQEAGITGHLLVHLRRA